MNVEEKKQVKTQRCSSRTDSLVRNSASAFTRTGELTRQNDEFLRARGSHDLCLSTETQHHWSVK